MPVRSQHAADSFWYLSLSQRCVAVMKEASAELAKLTHGED